MVRHIPSLNPQIPGLITTLSTELTHNPFAHFNGEWNNEKKKRGKDS